MSKIEEIKAVFMGKFQRAAQAEQIIFLIEEDLEDIQQLEEMEKREDCVFSVVLAFFLNAFRKSIWNIRTAPQRSNLSTLVSKIPTMGRTACVVLLCVG